MKAKINYKSKRVIIIIAIAIILLIAAISGTVAFIKGDNHASAVGAEETQVNEEVPNEEKVDNPAETDNEQVPLVDEKNNTNNSNLVENNTNNSNLVENNSNTKINNNNRAKTNEAKNETTEYIQTTLIPGRKDVLVNQNTQISWTPVVVPAEKITTQLEINKPNLEVTKSAYVGNEEITNNPANTVVQEGQEITYVIKVKNNGDLKTSTIRTTDTIPEGTELVEDSISNGGVYENGKITWKNAVEANETIEFSFKVKLISNSINLIENTAKVNGEDSPTVKTPAIKTTKEVFALIDGELTKAEMAKAKDTLRYVITVTNNSEVSGKTNIEDTIPEGTMLVENSISDNGKYTDGKIFWKDVEISANKSTTVSFDVTVNADRKIAVKNVAIVGEKNTPEVETKVANITTIKTSEGKHADGTLVTKENPLHELDEITYKLTSKNEGDGKGTVKISDTIPTGTTLVGNIKLDGKSYTEAELNAGINVTLKAGEEKSITFTVKINPFEDERITVRNADAKQDETPVPPTEDEVIKEYVLIDVNKKFVDKDNIDKYRPGEVTVGLYSSKDSKEFITTIKLNESNGWKGSFTGLNKYDLETKALIDYDVREINVDKNYNDTYTSEKEGDKVTFDITNTLKYENVKTNVTAKKIWDDNDGKVGARASVTFELYKNGEPTGITQTASDDENVNWTVTFQNLQKYKADGTEIEYTVKEVTRLPHYAEPVYGNDGSVLTVTNKIDYTTFTKDVSVKKIWVDPANTENEDITINIYQSGNN